MFSTRYGHFSADGTEYVIVNPDTPRPWVNIVANPDYGFALSHTGGGFSWIFSSKISALTRWNQDLAGDTDGKLLYLCEPHKHRTWSLNWNPFGHLGGEFRCTHGIGYSILERSLYDLHARMTCFVPPHDTLELWIVELTNLSRATRLLFLQSYFQWLCDQWPDAHREFHRTFLETAFVAPLNAIIARKRKCDVPHEAQTRPEWPYVAFHAVSHPPTAASGDTFEFLGRNRTLLNPRGLELPDRIGSFGRYGDACASLRVSLFLPPRESSSLVFLLGAAPSWQRARTLISRYGDTSRASRALAASRAHWQHLLTGFACKTPDTRLNLLANTWLKYQAISGRIFGKTGYYQNSGAFGFRDQLQDSQIWFPLNPSRARAHLSLCCSVQHRDGSVAHWWFPGTRIKHRTNCSDDFLWLPFILIQYLKETADFAFLDETVPYDDQGSGSVLDHALASVDRALQRLSPRGLPLIGDCDWNDGLSSTGDQMRGESIWLAHFLYLILNEISALLDRLGRQPERVAHYRAAAARLSDALNTHGWDGQWFWRATTDEGAVLGSRRCRKGRIFLNAQTWAVIANSAPAERQQIAIHAARRFLYKPYGTLLLYPGYTVPDPSIGYLTQYASGLRENGGVYTHAAVWAILAELLLGNADRAYERFLAICPIKPPSQVDNYACEPYVLPGNIDGPASPTPGRAGWTWYTGSAAWLFHVISSYILGIRPTYDGLLIDPCIPKHWPGFTVTRLFRGATFHISVKNPRRVSRGVSAVLADGQPVQMPLVVPPGRTVRISAIM
ncbi:MAG: glycosyl transferase family 36 [bacterium]|nr:glycosyl transferase family 36 [bacterium]